MTITIKPSNFAVSLRAGGRRATTLLIKPYLPDIVATPKTDREFTVSIVDDDPGVLKSLARLVRAAGFVVRTFSSAQEFLAQHDSDIPGCVVADLLMPGIDGRQLQSVLRKEDADRPVIFISGTTDAPTIVDAMKAGAIDFLVKLNQQLWSEIKYVIRLDLALSVEAYMSWPFTPPIFRIANCAN